MTARRFRPLAAVLAGLCVCACCVAEEGLASESFEALSQPASEPTVIVTLDTGETLRGVLITQNDVRARLLHPSLGILDVPNQRIKRIARVTRPEARQAQPSPRDEIEQAQDQAARSAERSTPDVEPPLTPPRSPRPAASPKPGDGATPDEPPKPTWSGSLEFGLSGAKGNTDRITTRSRAAIRRQATDEVFTASLRHRYTRDRDRDTENELFARTRQEWLFPGSPWSVFIEGDGELNRFRDYNILANALGGFGYEFLNTRDTLLIGRLSAGAGYQDAGRSEGVRPRARAAVEFRHNITPEITFTSSGEITPELDEWGEFRSRVSGAFDIALNESRSLRLRVGAEDRFDSDPGRRESHDIDYFISLVYGF